MLHSFGLFSTITLAVQLSLTTHWLHSCCLFSTVTLAVQHTLTTHWLTVNFVASSALPLLARHMVLDFQLDVIEVSKALPYASAGAPFDLLSLGKPMQRR